MYKLMIISGPNAGTSYALKEGENSIGRSSRNGIALKSKKISKQHCRLVVDNERVEVQDAGSINGTFVNGNLIREKSLQPGDRISIGNVVLELRRPVVKRSEQAPAIGDIDNVVPFPAPVPVGAVGSPVPGFTEEVPQNTVPTDLKGKFFWAFENYVMPFFYRLNLKNEWRSIAIGIFGIFIVLNLLITVQPVLDENRKSVLTETGRRARLIAQQIAEMNAEFLANNQETKTQIGTLENASGLNFAFLVDLDNRILAPPREMNNYLVKGDEASYAVFASKKFKAGRETGFTKLVNDRTLLAIEPIKVLDPRLGKNVVIAMAVVSMDTTLSVPDMGAIGVTYSKIFIFSVLLAALVLLILYRLTLKPFELLNEDIDKALTGEQRQVSKDFKTEETSQLWDVINSALQRIPKTAGSEGEFGFGGEVGGSPLTPDDFLPSVKMLSEISTFGVILCDSEKKVVHINSVFEEISGIRLEEASGRKLEEAARDEALSALLDDLFGQVANSHDFGSDHFDFGGVGYKVHIAALGAGPSLRGYFIVVVKDEFGV